MANSNFSQGLLVDEKDSELFFDKGYVVLKGCIPKDECKRYLESVIKPVMRSKFNVHSDNPSTWSLENVSKFVMNEGSIGGVPYGVMLRNEDGSDPIGGSDGLWTRAMESEKLLAFLNYIHGGRNNWKWLHPDNVGWIHVRFPLDRAQVSEDDQNDVNWHVDGGHFEIHKIDSPEQSVVVLPMMDNVVFDGGNTLVIAESHKYISKVLQNNAEGINKDDLMRICEDYSKKVPKENIEQAAPCEAGDILVLHPFVIHSASRNISSSKLRITFNMGIRWKSEWAPSPLTRKVFTSGDS